MGDDRASDEPDHRAGEGFTETDSQPLGAGAATARGRAPLVLATSLAVLFAVVAAVLAVLLAGAGDDDPGDEVRQMAGRFGEVLVSYDHTDPDAHRDAVLSMSTGSFRDEYEAAFDQGLRQIITEVGAVSTGFVKDVYLTEIDEERAQAIVVADIEHEGPAGPKTLYDVYFRLTLVEVSGTWKVDQVTDLNFDISGGTGGAAPVTTDTTATTATSVP